MKCPVCESVRTKLVCRSKNQKLGDILKCKDCKLLFTSFLPSDQVISEIYNGLYGGREKFDFIDHNKLDQVRKSVAEYFSIYKEIKGDKSNISFLDLAGGLGYVAYSAATYTNDVTLVEMDSESANFAKTKLKIDTVNNLSIKEFFSRNKKKYDFIVFRHVIEHLKFPFDTLDGISEVLNNGGILVLETPNSVSFEALLHPRLCRSFYKNLRKEYQVNFISFVINKLFHIRPPIHLFIHSEKSLNLLLRKMGLQIRKSITYKFQDEIFWQKQSKKENPLTKGFVDSLKNKMNLLIVAEKS